MAQKQALALGHYLRRPKLFIANDRQLSAEDFEFVLAAKKRQYRDVWEDLEPVLRRQRTFEQIKAPTPLEVSELKKMLGQTNIKSSVSPLLKWQ
jgi:hypothetical protein